MIHSHLVPNQTYWVLKNVDIPEFKPVGDLKGKTIVISGGSRGIGLAIAKRAAKDGANIVLLAKTTEPHPVLVGTLHTAAAEIEKLGGKALPIKCDTRSEEQVVKAIETAVKTFGGIDILVNNASAISLTPILSTDMKKYDLMNQVNTRGAYLLSRVCIPHLLKSKNPHILNMSPPLSVNPKWFGPHVAYSISKYGMSMCALGISEEYKGQIGVNALWPRTAVATQAIKFILNDEGIKRSRTDEIMGDAAYKILTSCHKHTNGNFFIDDEVLGPQNLTKYNVDKTVPLEELIPDFFID